MVVPNYDGLGHSAVVKADDYIIYYVESAANAGQLAETQKAIPLVPGKRYVFGFNMDDGGKPTDDDHGEGAWLLTPIAAANAANAAAGGSSTRYSVSNIAPTDAGDNFRTAAAYTCTGGTVPNLADRGGNGAGSAKYLTTTSGGDPYAGTCESAQFTGSYTGTTLTVTSVLSGVMQVGQGIPMAGYSWGDYTIQSQLSGTTGGTGTYAISKNNGATVTSFTNATATHQFYIAIAGPDCDDGKNLWTPGGYKGIIPDIYDSKYSSWVCPKNYYRIPSLHLEVGYTQYGWADRQRWVLSSDAGARTRLSCSTANCPNGFSFHTDWMHGWDMVVMNKWLTNCSGVMHNIAHQCAVSQISATEQLVGHFGCGANNRCPQVDVSPLARLNVSDPGWGKIPPAWSNSISSMHMHSN
jgi:hypothetical protein